MQNALHKIVFIRFINLLFIYSPEETSDAGLLIDVGSSQQTDAKNNILQPADYTKLVDIQPPSLSNENYLINVDNVNSNILSPEKSYTGFDDCLQKKSDASVAGNHIYQNDFVKINFCRYKHISIMFYKCKMILFILLFFLSVYESLVRFMVSHINVLKMKLLKIIYFPFKIKAIKLLYF